MTHAKKRHIAKMFTHLFVTNAITLGVIYLLSDPDESPVTGIAIKAGGYAAGRVAADQLKPHTDDLVDALFDRLT
jgi:hypothetical protein